MAKVLIVDDNWQLRAFMRECLKTLGFTDIAEAANGRMAMESCVNSMPDIITLDWNMPEMDGLTFLKTLRKFPGGEKPTIVFCSTEGSHTKIQQVMASGANEYITKPFDVNILREKFEKLKLLPSY